MKSILKYNILMLLAGIILSTIIYSLSPFKIGNRADIIEFMGIIFFFSTLSLINIIGYLLLHYIFKIDIKIIFKVTNILILLLILFNHSREWKNTYLLICTPIYFLLQFLIFLYYKKRIKM
ncbi:hypothetical protein BJQ96_02946 [Flavobacterium sp. PL0002]|nr:hypothetical protein [Flavobacterium sp. PL002]